MLSDSIHPTPSASVCRARSAREIEFSEALDRYLASYNIEAGQPGHRRAVRNADGTPTAVWYVVGFIIVALKLLGGAVSAGGRHPPVGIM